MKGNYKLYSAQGVYLASTATAVDALRLVAHHPGSRVRHTHRKIVWSEGREAFLAKDNVERAADVVSQRVHDYVLGTAK